jgi:hypothetical protein
MTLSGKDGRLRDASCIDLLRTALQKFGWRCVAFETGLSMLRNERLALASLRSRRIFQGINNDRLFN